MSLVTLECSSIEVPSNLCQEPFDIFACHIMRFWYLISFTGKLCGNVFVFSKEESSEHTFCYLAELDGDSLDLYGPGSLDAIDKNWGEKTAASVLSIKFKFIKFPEIIPLFKKLHLRFPGLQVCFLF